MSHQFFLFSQTEFWNSVPLVTLQIPALETNFWFNSWGISVLAAICLAALNHSKNHKFASAYTSATSSLRKSILQFWSGSILDRIAISLRNSSSFSSSAKQHSLSVGVNTNRITSFWHSDLGSQYKIMYVWINVLFFLLIISNFFGLFPFFEAITGKTGLTIGLSFAVWFTVTFCGIQKQGVKMIKLFLPSGPHWLMSPIFVLLESISYTFRALSLGVRLWANILSGHQLLHLFTGMALVPALCLNILVGFPVTLIVTSILIALTGLECIVCILQSGVFCILTSFYLNEVLHTKNGLNPKA